MLHAALRRPAVLTVLLTTLVIPFAGSALADGVTDPAPVAVAALPTTLRITTPSTVRVGSAADVSVRLVHTTDAGDQPVPDKQVLIQRSSPTGWVQVASLTTRDQGLGHALVPIGKTARFRAVFRGDDAAQAATSREVIISAGTLGDRAIAEARRHYGAPYSWG